MPNRQRDQSIRARIHRDLWDPENPRIWKRKEFGYGWTINLAALLRRIARRAKRQ